MNISTGGRDQYDYMHWGFLLMYSSLLCLANAVCRLLGNSHDIAPFCVANPVTVRHMAFNRRSLFSCAKRRLMSLFSSGQNVDR